MFFVTQVLRFVENFNVGIHSDTVDVINVTLDDSLSITCNTTFNDLDPILRSA